MLAFKRLAVIVAVVAVCHAVTAAEGPKIDVYFSPDGGCSDAIVKAIGEAKKVVRIQAYSFTSEPIAKALIDAKKRGVKIEAVLDKSNQTDKYSAATFLVNQGIPVVIDGKHAVAHNKVILIDDDTIITGSFNFSKAAETANAENLLVIRDAPELFVKYIANFAAHQEHSTPYLKPKPDTGADSTLPVKTPTDTKVDRPADGKAQDVTVYVSKTGAKYHRQDCTFLVKSKIPMSLKDAVQKGYTPCSRCSPPKLDDKSTDEDAKREPD